MNWVEKKCTAFGNLWVKQMSNSKAASIRGGEKNPILVSLMSS